MESVKYVGPKPIISHTGIEFDTNKEDKFVYISIAIDLVKALSSNDYLDNKTYTYISDKTVVTADDMMRELKKLCPDLKNLMNRENHHVEDEIEHNIQRTKSSNTLNEVEKEVLYKNIEMMHDYLIQRSVNKTVYYCVIDALAELVKKDHIDYIVAPMTQRFMHVFHSVEGVLHNERFPIDTKLEIYKKNGVLLVKLQVINS